MTNVHIPVKQIKDLFSKRLASALQGQITELAQAKDYDIIAVGIEMTVDHHGIEIERKPYAVMMKDSTPLTLSLYDMIMSDDCPRKTIRRLMEVENNLTPSDDLDHAESELHEQGGDYGHTPTLTVFLTPHGLVSIIEQDLPTPEDVEGESIFDDQYEIDTRVRVLVPEAKTAHEKISRTSGDLGIVALARYLIRAFEPQCPELADLEMHVA